MELTRLYFGYIFGAIMRLKILYDEFVTLNLNKDTAEKCVLRKILRDIYCQFNLKAIVNDLWKTFTEMVLKIWI